MITILGLFPEMTDPDFVMELAAITLMVGGTVGGGPTLLPGSLFQVPPQLAGLGVTTLAKPLNASGADPPLKLLAFAQLDPQKVTFFPTTASKSPITKLP